MIILESRVQNYQRGNEHMVFKSQALESDRRALLSSSSISPAVRHQANYLTSAVQLLDLSSRLILALMSNNWSGLQSPGPWEGCHS